MENKKTTVSLCIIAYNEETVINGILRDFSIQDYPHELIEVIMVDGESTDNTREIMEEFAKTNYGFKDIKVTSCCKHRQAASWNVALKEATGDVIIRIDAHAKIPRSYVSRCVFNIESGENVVGGGRPNITEDHSSWKLTLLAAEDSLFGSSIASYRRPPEKKEYLDSLFHAAYRREVFEKAGIFNEDLGRTEDNEMHYRIRQNGYKMCSCPDIISYQLTRNSLKHMIKQKYSNGYWIGLTTGVCPQCLSYYHYVPLLFVGAMLVCAGLACFGFALPLIALCALYGMFDIVNTVGCFTVNKVRPHFVLLPFLFPLLHISYGIGTIIGLVHMPFWRKKILHKKAD
ncbi:MAG: glycosyltransferase family 2 protein [Oscillospiraceae bacterium]|jgi:glycosyltransferase involved in cell wall biosynthesis|nr:glycosyltransferase family 2 protein [Oscillospiraceae bacterium]